MSDILRRHKYAVERILIPAARILSPEFNAAYLFLTGAHIELLRNLVDYATRDTTFVDEYHEGYYLTPDVDDMDTILSIVADLEDMLMTIVLGYYDAYVCVRDKKTSGTHGGTFTSGDWRTRDINEEYADPQAICSIASNQITLQKGTYRCAIACPARSVTACQARLYNISDSAELLLSASNWFDQSNDDSNSSLILGRFTLADTKVLEVQHRCAASKATSGFGYACGWADEIYTVAEFWRET